MSNEQGVHLKPVKAHTGPINLLDECCIYSYRTSFVYQEVLLCYDYTRIHLSPWWMLFRSHINIYRFWSIFFTYSLTLYDGAILFSDDYWIQCDYWLWSGKIKKHLSKIPPSMFVDLSSCAHGLLSWYFGSAHTFKKVPRVLSRLGGAGVYILIFFTIGVLNKRAILMLR